MVLQRARLLVCGSVLVISAPAFATEKFTRLPPILGSNAAFESLQDAYQTVQQNSYVRQLLNQDDTHALSISARVSGYGVETTKFQHFYKGLEVMGSMTFHHASPQGTEVRNVINRFDLDTRPGITAETATSIAHSVAGDLPLNRAPELKILPSSSEESARLIYWVDFDSRGFIPGSDVLIDARDGKVVASISKLETVAQVQVLSAKDQGISVLPLARKNPQTGEGELTGCKITDLSNGTTSEVTIPNCREIIRGKTDLTDGQCQLLLHNTETSANPLGVDPSACLKVVTDGKTSPKADASARRAQDNAQKVLAYFREKHGRDGFDNAGSDVVSIVHVGLKFGNAAWVRGLDFMMYGDGDGEVMGDMTQGVDVAGHELTHGITSKTAKLTMMDQAGALNEAYSDFFGKVIAQDGSWVLGASLSMDPAQFAGIRDMAKPSNMTSTHPDGAGEEVTRPYPAKASEAEKKLASTTCDESNDRCWVHFNSTVPGHASYLIYNAIGAEKTEALYYLTLTQYLSSEANFAKAAEATLAACKTRFDAATCSTVREIFVKTEMLKN
jgi:bacillolysin